MRQIFTTVGGLVVAVLMCSGSSAHAQTTAIGPYYAAPSWDQTIACTAPANCPRFIVLANFNNEAVLDRETGLVWERTPKVTRHENLLSADGFCLIEATGGRFGWRLPTAAEFGSLLDAKPLVFITAGQLPLGHPFTVGVSGGIFEVFWSSTMFVGGPGTHADTAEFHSDGTVVLNPRDKIDEHRYWCVRGPNSK